MVSDRRCVAMSAVVWSGWSRGGPRQPQPQTALWITSTMQPSGCSCWERSLTAAATVSWLALIGP